MIGQLVGKTEKEIKELRNEMGIHAAYKIVDTCAAEFDAETPYYYSCYDGENEVEETSGKKKLWYWAPDQFVLDRELSLIIVVCTVYGH